MTASLLLLIFGGLALLILGGELLVRGASRIAQVFGLSPLAIGLTVVAYGTSTPELAVSVKAGLMGNDGLAVANVVGSNIFNVLFILGTCALILPLVVARGLMRVDVPIMIGVSGAVWVFALDGRLSRVEGLLFLAGLVGYTLLSLRRGRDDASADTGSNGTSTAVESRGRRIATAIAFAAAGLGILMAGARMLVDGSVQLATNLGVDETVIGLTIVAAGTSLPEVATSVVATIRGQRDIAIGNVIGSNIYNILGILGVSSVVTSGGLSVAPSLLALDIPLMVAVAVVCLTTFFTGLRIARWEGAVFLGAYVVYTAYLVLQQAGDDAAGGFRFYVGAFLLPITVLLLLASFLRGLHAHARGRA